MHSDSFRRRMIPLYVAIFLRNVVFWYSVEKLFMTSIGYNNELIAIMVVIYSATSILMEIPSGILADRWSRKGVLALGIVSLAVSSMIGFVSYGVAIYFVSAIFWGFFDALASGTDEAVVYDTLIEERGHADDFEKEYGFYKLWGGVALVIAGILGGVIGEHIGLRDTYLWSIPPLLLAALATTLFRDPSFHKRLAEARLATHIRQTFSSVFRNPRLIWILITLFTVGLSSGIVAEMQQLWLIAAGAAVIVFGITGSLINGSWGFGGLLARFFVRKSVIIAGLIIVISLAIALVYTRNVIVLVALLASFAILVNAIFVAMTAQLHRELPSNVRSGASSALNTVARLIMIPLIICFGWLAQTYGPFTAAWLLVALIGIGLYAELRPYIRRTRYN